ncbi:unnamed protein product, partial [Soboliphyme baturini]|uniref:Helicase ATP-binding domain-containing protein n=1 Tax=Soboliphyme baturini TaxID=241478 RepID=A0A183I8S1_9BILA
RDRRTEETVEDGEDPCCNPDSSRSERSDGKRPSSPIFTASKSPRLCTSLSARLSDRFTENANRVKEECQDRFYGLPAKVRDIFRKSRGIDELYEWQVDCLNHSAVRDGNNLLIHTPTGGGKTLLAEILILKQLLCARKDVIFVLPFVSIVQEKVKALVPLGLELEFLVEEYAASKGRIPPIKRRRKKSVFVATIEKAQSLIQSLIESKRIEDLGLAIVDEVHMIGEGGSRGSTVEQMLSTLLYAAPQCQLIGISATLSNMTELQTYLKAELFNTSFRPVELTEFVKLDDSVYRVNKTPESTNDILQFYAKSGSAVSCFTV